MPFRPFQKGDKIARLAKKLKNPKEALKILGLMMVSDSQRAFIEQSYGGKKWPPRGPVNVMGIIADLSSGRSIPKRRFDQRPALIDTGLLRNSIASKIIGNAVEVGTKVEYAKDHQKGGKVKSETITGKVQTALWTWLKKKANRKWQPQLGWLLNRKFKGRRLDGKVPARPFIGVTKQTKNYIKQIVVEMLEVQGRKK